MKHREKIFTQRLSTWPIRAAPPMVRSACVELSMDWRRANEGLLDRDVAAGRLFVFLLRTASQPASQPESKRDRYACHKLDPRIPQEPMTRPSAAILSQGKVLKHTIF